MSFPTNTMTQDKPASVLLVIILPSDPNLSLH